MLVPLKVKCFIWLVIRDRVAVRDILQRLGLVQGEGNVCSICNEGKEDSRHIFVHCVRVYKVWARVANTWNMNFVGGKRCGFKFECLVSYIS